MERMVSKSKFKARALEYFRQVEETGEEFTITDHGQPVLKVIPYSPNSEGALKVLRNSVLNTKTRCSPWCWKTGKRLSERR